MPDVPENVVVEPMTENAMAVKWERAPRADHYRVWVRVVGVDAEPVAVGSPVNLDFTIEGAPPGATVEVAVSAVNNGSESARSEVITFVIGETVGPSVPKTLD